MADDQTIRITALASLKSTAYPAVRRLDCRVTDRVVELYGVVDSFYMKQVAQEAVKRVRDVKRIENKLDVGSDVAIAGRR